MILLLLYKNIAADCRMKSAFEEPIHGIHVTADYIRQSAFCNLSVNNYALTHFTYICYMEF
jgi:hypothetical protein